MEISLTNAGKRFRFDWIFRELTCTLRSGQRVALIGPNGSGKSTLMKVLAGHLSLSKGQIVFKNDAGTVVPPEEVYQWVSYAAPYIELIEEFTLEEAIQFHCRLKPLLPGLTPEKLYEILDLPKALQKEIRFFSSGMKQRVKLAFAICSNTPIVLLDEPSTNLDVRAVSWFHDLLQTYHHDRLILIATNDPTDLELCGDRLDVMGYKKKEAGSEVPGFREER